MSAPEDVKSGCGTGFVAALDQADAEAVAEESEDARIIGTVQAGAESVAIRGLALD